jgi:hypothetical protein
MVVVDLPQQRPGIELLQVFGAVVSEMRPPCMLQSQNWSSIPWETLSLGLLAR